MVSSYSKWPHSSDFCIHVVLLIFLLSLVGLVGLVILMVGGGGVGVRAHTHTLLSAYVHVENEAIRLLPLPYSLKTGSLTEPTFHHFCQLLGPTCLHLPMLGSLACASMPTLLIS